MIKHNDELKQSLDQKLTDEQIFYKARQNFDFTTNSVLKELEENEASRNLYRFNPIFRISLTSDLYLNKELLKRFTDMVEEHGYRHEFNLPQNAYCIYINQK